MTQQSTRQQRLQNARIMPYNNVTDEVQKGHKNGRDDAFTNVTHHSAAADDDYF